MDNAISYCIPSSGKILSSPIMTMLFGHLIKVMISIYLYSRGIFSYTLLSVLGGYTLPPSILFPSDLVDPFPNSFLILSLVIYVYFNPIFLCA